VWLDHEGADESVNHEADEHDSSTVHEGLSTTHFGDDQKYADDGSEDVNGSEDDGCDKGVVDAGGFKDCCAIVEDWIGISKTSGLKCPGRVTYRSLRR
jgi:hypothetical protein